MRRFDIAQSYAGGLMVESPEDGDYVLHEDVAPAIAALEHFIKQYNACGPNSSFGRIFQRTYVQALDALAKAGVKP